MENKKQESQSPSLFKSYRGDVSVDAVGRIAHTFYEERTHNHKGKLNIFKLKKLHSQFESPNITPVLTMKKPNYTKYYVINFQTR